MFKLNSILWAPIVSICCFFLKPASKFIVLLFGIKILLRHVRYINVINISHHETISHWYIHYAAVI